MNDAEAVRVVEGVGDLLGDPQGHVDRKLTLADQPVVQGLALQKGHDVVQEAVGFAGVEQGKDMGMGKRGGDPDLAQEAIRPEGRRQLRPQDLDGHSALVPEVLGQVDRRHSPAAYLAQDVVARGQRGSKPLELIRRAAHDCGLRR